MRALRPLLLTGLAMLVAMPATASRTVVPRYVQGHLAPGAQHIYAGRDVVFRGQELAIVQVLGDGDADLDLYVYDDAGNLICRRDSTATSEQCSWTPRWTGSFRIVVRNAGTAGSSYALRTN